MWPQDWLFPWLWHYCVGANQFFLYYCICSAAMNLRERSVGSSFLVKKALKRGGAELTLTIMLLATWHLIVAFTLACVFSDFSVMMWGMLVWVLYILVMYFFPGIFSHQVDCVQWELAIYKYMLWWGPEMTRDRRKSVSRFVMSVKADANRATQERQAAVNRGANRATQERQADVNPAANRATQERQPSFTEILYLYPATMSAIEKASLDYNEENKKPMRSTAKLAASQKEVDVGHRLQKNLFRLKFLFFWLVCMRLLWMIIFVVFYFVIELAKRQSHNTLLQDKMNHAKEYENIFQGLYE